MFSCVLGAKSLALLLCLIISCQPSFAEPLSPHRPNMRLCPGSAVPASMQKGDQRVCTQSCDRNSTQGVMPENNKGLVRLQKPDNPTGCSGYQVSPCVVLTAAHCEHRRAINNFGKNRSNDPAIANVILDGGLRFSNAAPSTRYKDYLFLSTDQPQANKCAFYEPSQGGVEPNPQFRDLGPNPANHHPFVVLLKGYKGPCYRHNQSQIIICPEEYRTNGEIDLKIQGFPTEIHDKPTPGRWLPANNLDQKFPIETANCRGVIEQTGVVSHLCSTWKGGSGGPVKARIKLQSGEDIEAILAVTSGSDIGLSKNKIESIGKATIPSLTREELDKLSGQINRCESGQWKENIDGKACNLIESTPIRWGTDEPAPCEASGAATVPSINVMQTSKLVYFCKGGIYIDKERQDRVSMPTSEYCRHTATPEFSEELLYLEE